MAVPGMVWQMGRPSFGQPKNVEILGNLDNRRNLSRLKGEHNGCHLIARGNPLDLFPLAEKTRLVN